MIRRPENLKKWGTLADAISDPQAKINEIGYLDPTFLLLLKDIPWMASSFGFERALGQNKLGQNRLPAVDLAIHLDPQQISPPETDKRWDKLWQHDIWSSVLSLPDIIDKQSQIALEFDANRSNGKILLPIVFLVRDDLITQAQDQWSQWTQKVQDQWLPHLRMEKQLPKSLGHTLKQMLDDLPPCARAVHFGTLSVRGIDAIRLCIAGITISEFANKTANFLQQNKDKAVELLIQISDLIGDIRYINVDIVGENILPRLGFEIHLPGLPEKTGTGMIAKNALNILLEHKLIHHHEYDQLQAWCGIEQSGLIRSITHIKVQLEINKPPRIKAYLKVSPPNKNVRANQSSDHGSTLPCLNKNPNNCNNKDYTSKYLQDGFLRQALNRPDSIAIIQGTDYWTYAELEYTARHVVAGLQKAKISSGMRIGIYLPHGSAHVVAVLAILSAGAIYVPADPDWPVTRVNQVFSQAEISGFIGLAESASLINQSRLNVALTKQTANPKVTIENISTPKLAYIIFTSGSTGSPKGVMVTHQSALNTLKYIATRFKINNNDRILALSSLAFDLSVWDIFGTLDSGSTLVFPEVNDKSLPFRAAQALTIHKITIWNSVPATFSLVLDILRSDSLSLAKKHALRLIMLSGDWIPVTLPQSIWQQLGKQIQIVSLGGSTEGSIWSILHVITPSDKNQTSIPYGKPDSMAQQLMIPIRPDGSTCHLNEPGQLIIKGKGVVEGYYNDPVTTAKKFQTDKNGMRIFLTGDDGYLRDDGIIQLLGRQDFQVKIQGYRVDLTEISSHFSAFDNIKQVAVGVIHPDDSSPRLGVAVVLKKTVQNLSNKKCILDWHQSLSKQLPGYAVPLIPDIQLVKELPLTRNQKIDQIKLFGKQKVQTASANKFLSIFQTALGKPDLKASDNIFEQGANSLIAVWIITQVENLSSRQLSVITLYNHPTAEQFEKYCRQSNDDSSTNNLAFEIPDLPPEIDTQGLTLMENDLPVFLTGSTGAIGPYVVSELRQQGRDIICLVRGVSVSSARQKLQIALEKSDLAGNLDGINLVVGDISRPYFGLDQAAFQALAQRVGIIIHLAASVGFAQSIENLNTVNVKGTIEVLRLATTEHIHPVYLMSTTAVHGLLFNNKKIAREAAVDNQPVTDRGILEGNYPLSKWIAEQVAVQAKKRGVPLSILRPAFILGSQDLKNTPMIGETDNLLATAILTSFNLGVFPKLPWTLPVISLEQTASAIVSLALNPKTLGHFFHLTPTDGLSMDDLAAARRQLGYGMREITWPLWRSLVEERANQGDPAARLIIQTTTNEVHLLQLADMETNHSKHYLGSIPASTADEIITMLSPPNPTCLYDLHQQNIKHLQQATNAWLAKLSWIADDHDTQLPNAITDILNRQSKRLRPILFLVIATADRLTLEEALPIAGALEMLHTMSLIHDDLPGMDDANLRRGQAALHCLYGEGIAILAGDALLARAFETVAAHESISSSQRVLVLSTLSRACGRNGLAYGQACDLAGRSKHLTIKKLAQIAAWKTGALFGAACRAGAEVTGHTPHTEVLETFGINLGILFQINDDLLDQQVDDKTTAQDEKFQTANILRLYGPSAVDKQIEQSIKNCKNALAHCATGSHIPILNHILNNLITKIQTP